MARCYGRWETYYATPEDPEYYECDPRPLQDTYIITE